MLNKNLGQNFLHCKNTLQTIAEAIDIKKKVVIEVGGGAGNLTSYLLQKDFAVLNILEKDFLLAKTLEELKGNRENVFIKRTDCLKENLDCDVLFSNLPYCISSAFLQQLLRSQISTAVLILQKEVCDKIRKPDNPLGIIFNLCSKIQVLKEVSAQCFFPVPRVKSQLIRIDFFPSPYTKHLDQLYAMFKEKRKKLKNIGHKGFLEQKRPEEVTLSQWKSFLDNN